MTFFLGIDLGLSGARAAILDDRGALVGRGRCTTDAMMRGAAEQDPDEWLSAVAHAVRQAMGEAGGVSIEAIGVGAIGPCAVTLDERLRPTGLASLFSYDSRHEAWRRRLIEAGAKLDNDHVVPKIERMRECDPDRFARTAWVVDATGFLVGALTGNAVMDRVTRLDHTLAGQEPPRPVPDAAAADSLAGVVSAEGAIRFGLAEGIPVTVGSYDSYVDLFGAGVRKTGDSGILLGTTTVVCRVLDEPVEEGVLRITPHVGAGVMIGGWTSSSGSVLNWAAEMTGAGKVNGRPLKPGRSGLIMLPYFAGERTPVWDPLARGALVGLTLSTSGEDIRQAAVEAVALATTDIVQRLDAVCGRAGSYVVAGGGAAIPGLTQAIADATGAVLEVVSNSGEACAGAVLAAHAVGKPIRRGIERTVHPNTENTGSFEELMAIYRPLYAQLADAMHRLGDLAARRAGR